MYITSLKSVQKSPQELLLILFPVIIVKKISFSHLVHTLFKTFLSTEKHLKYNIIITFLTIPTNYRQSSNYNLTLDILNYVKVICTFALTKRFFLHIFMFTYAYKKRVQYVPWINIRWHVENIRKKTNKRKLLVLNFK